MASPIVVEFILRGMPDIARAMRTVEQAAVASERAQSAARQRGAQQRQAIVDREARDKVRAMIKADAEAKRIQDQAYRDVERRAAQRAAAFNKELREELRAVDRAAKERIRIEQQAEREVARIGDAARKRARREYERETREQERDATRRRGEQERFARGVGGAVTSAVGRGVTRAAGLMTSTAGVVGQLGGGFSVGDSVQRELGLHRLAGKIAASTVTAPGQQQVTTAGLVGQARAIGIEQGVEPAEIMEGIEQFKNLTGDTGRAIKLMPELSKLATAFGANIGELAQNAGNIALADPKGQMTNADIMKLLRVQTRQGAVGAVELEHLAKYGGRLTGAAGLFEGDRATNIAKLGALTQIARQRGTGVTPAEAAMAGLRFSTDVAKNAQKLEAQGIKTQGAGGTLRDPQEILIDMLKKTGGDVSKLGGLGLGERGVKPLIGLADVFRGAGGGAKGEAAVRAELGKFTEGVSDAEVNERARTRLADADKQVERAFLELRTIVGRDLLPEFLKLVPEIRKLTPALVDALRVGLPAIVDLMKTLADFAQANRGIITSIAAHPVGSLIAFELTKSFAAAAIPALLTRLLSGLLGGAGGAGGGVGGVGSAAAGALGGAGGVAAAGIAGGVLAGAVATNSELKYEAGNERAQDLAAKVRAYTAGDRERGVSPEAAALEVAAARGRLAQTGTFAQVGNIIKSPFSDEASKNYGQFKADQGLTENKELIAALREATTAIRASTTAGGGVGGKPAAASVGAVQRTK